MAKQDQKKKRGEPSSLHHYTSMETLVTLLNNVHENREDEKDKNLYLTFHASDAYQMNDKAEGVLLLNKFFTDSKTKTEYKEYYAQVEERKGGIYVISFCRSDQESAHSGSIPMWSMYGQNGKGAILVFSYKNLEEYVHSKNENMSLRECQYKKTQDVQDLTAKKNKEVKEADDKIGSISELRLEAFGLKDWRWEYESEWRILVKDKNSKLKTINNNVVAYTEVRIPVNCLRSIIIGHLVEFEATKKILDAKISELKKTDGSIDIKVKHSKLQIR